MKDVRILYKIIILSIASLIFAFCGFYFDKIFLTLGLLALFLASIFLTIIKGDKNERKEDRI